MEQENKERAYCEWYDCFVEDVQEWQQEQEVCKDKRCDKCDFFETKVIKEGDQKDYFAYCHHWEEDVTKIAGWQIEKCHQDCLAGERCPYYEEIEMRFN